MALGSQQRKSMVVGDDEMVAPVLTSARLKWDGEGAKESPNNTILR